MCYWKQWRRCRTKVRKLLKLGTPLDAAISVGLSRKGPWKLARTLATQIGMTNQWLKGQGLISVKELVGEHSLSGYVQIAYELPSADTHAG